jgi:hypothetical protein
MRPARTPVETLAAERHFAGKKVSNINTKIVCEGVTCFGQAESSAACPQKAATDKTVEQSNSKVACKVVITNTRLAKRVIPWPCPASQMA